MRQLGIDWDLAMIGEEYCEFGGFGLTLNQLRILQWHGFTVPELDEWGRWVSPQVERLVLTARMYRLHLEQMHDFEIRDIR